MYPDSHKATRGCPRSEPRGDQLDGVSDGVDDAVCAGWFCAVCDLLSTCVLRGASRSLFVMVLVLLGYAAQSEVATCWDLDSSRCKRVN